MARSKLPPIEIVDRLRALPGSHGETYFDPATGERFTRYAVRSQKAPDRMSPEALAALRRAGLPPKRYVADAYGRKIDQLGRLKSVSKRYQMNLERSGVKVSTRDLWRRATKPTVRIEATQTQFYDALNVIRTSKDSAGRFIVPHGPDSELAHALETLGFRPPGATWNVGTTYTDRVLEALNDWRAQFNLPPRAEPGERQKAG